MPAVLFSISDCHTYVVGSECKVKQLCTWPGNHTLHFNISWPL